MRAAAIIIILVIWGIVAMTRSASQKKTQSQQRERGNEGEKPRSPEELLQKNEALSRGPTPQRVPTRTSAPAQPTPRDHLAAQWAAERTVEAKPAPRRETEAWENNAAAVYRRPTAYCQECGAKVYGTAACPICGARIKKTRQGYEPYT